MPNSAFLERWPLPDNVGVHIDPQDGAKIERVTIDTPAAKAGLKAGDMVTHVDGQPIISIADIQWVLHNLSSGNASMLFTVTRGGKDLTHRLSLSPGWKKGDISWRGSMWSLRPRPGYWAREMKPDEVAAANVPAGIKPTKVQVLNGNQPQGKAAKDAGLRTGDVIVGVDDKPLTMSPAEFNVYVRLQHKVGDQLKLTVLREGREEKIAFPLLE